MQAPRDAFSFVAARLCAPELVAGLATAVEAIEQAVRSLRCQACRRRTWRVCWRCAMNSLGAITGARATTHSWGGAHDRAFDKRTGRHVQGTTRAPWNERENEWPRAFEKRTGRRVQGTTRAARNERENE